MLTKIVREIRMTAIANRSRNGLYSISGVQKEMLGLLDPKLSKIVAKRRSHFFFEQSSEVILADPQRFTEFRQGKRWICEFFTENRECSIYAQIPCLFHHSKSSPPWLSPASNRIEPVAYRRFHCAKPGLRARMAEIDGEIHRMSNSQWILASTSLHLFL